MPRKSLEYAAELYRERDNIFTSLNSKYTYEYLIEKEHEFVNFCKELADTKGMILSLPTFLKSKKQSLEDELVWSIGYYIILLSNDENAFSSSMKKIPPKAISMLDKEEQKNIIEKYIKENLVGKVDYIIEDNNYIEYIDEVINQNNGYKFIAAFHQSKGYNLLLETFKEESAYEKEMLALDLLPAPLPEIWAYYQQRTSNGDNIANETLCLYGSPSDFSYINTCIKASWEDTGALINIGNWLRWFGYAGRDGFTMYLTMLKHPDNDVREIYHRLMMSFFKKDDSMMQDAWDLINTESETMLNFWKEKKDYVNQTLNPSVRIWHGEPFDLLRVTEIIADSPVIGDMGGIVSHLRIWTGENFAFDSNALFEKQFEQFEAIKQWLRDNKERFPAGRWYRWGRDVTNDSVTAMQEQSSIDFLKQKIN